VAIDARNVSGPTITLKSPIGRLEGLVALTMPGSARIRRCGNPIAVVSRWSIRETQININGLSIRRRERDYRQAACEITRDAFQGR